MIRTCIDSVVSRDRRLVILPTAMARLWSHTSWLSEFWDVVQVFGAWSGAAIIEDRHGLRLTLSGVDLGHLRWGGRLVLPFGPNVRNALVAEKMARIEPERPNANKVVLDIRNATDVNRALSLLRLAYLISDSDRNDRRSSHAQHTLLSPIPSSKRLAFDEIPV
jgi:hypothetical protein